MTTTFVQVAEVDRRDDQVTASGAAGYDTVQRVIVGVDDTPAGQAALRWAVIKARSEGAQLVAVRAWALGLPRHGGRRHRHPDRSPVVYAFAGDSQREAATTLIREEFATTVGGIPSDIPVRIEVSEGDPAVVLTQLAVADGDLLVLGDHYASSLHRMVHGSVSSYCTAHSRCPVVIVSLTGSPVVAGGSPSQPGPNIAAGPAGPDQPQVREA